MDNVYQQSNMMYSEIAEALDDYKYGGYCKLYIPSVCALLPKSTKSITRRNSTSNIMNKEPEKLGISKYTSESYVSLYIPNHLCPHCGGTMNVEHYHSPCKECSGEVHHMCSHSGKKGDKFVVTFIEGDIQKCSVVGRYQG